MTIRPWLVSLAASAALAAGLAGTVEATASTTAGTTATTPPPASPGSMATTGSTTTPGSTATSGSTAATPVSTATSGSTPLPDPPAYCSKILYYGVRADEAADAADGTDATAAHAAFVKFIAVADTMNVDAPTEIAGQIAAAVEVAKGVDKIFARVGYDASQLTDADQTELQSVAGSAEYAAAGPVLKAYASDVCHINQAQAAFCVRLDEYRVAGRSVRDALDAADPVKIKAAFAALDPLSADLRDALPTDLAGPLGKRLDAQQKIEDLLAKFNYDPAAVEADAAAIAELAALSSNDEVDAANAQFKDWIVGNCGLPREN